MRSTTVTSSISTRPRSSSLTDRASVRGVKRRVRKNRKRGVEVQPKRRAIFGFGKVVLGLGVAAALGVAGLELSEHLEQSELFELERIEVTGNTRASESALVRLSGIALKDNLMAMDVDATARMVEAHPWVAEATVSRRWPKGVELHVVEHEPRVLVALDHFYYANADGTIVKRYSPGERETLPVVTGLSREQIETDDGESRAKLLLALRFLDELDATLGAAAPGIEEIHVDTAMGLSFTQPDDKTRVVIGHPPWAERITRLDRVKEALERRGVEASTIMLDGQQRKDRAVARLESGPGEP